MTDYISRADAIEAVHKANILFRLGVKDSKPLPLLIEDEIKALPSADAVRIPIKLEKRYPESKDEDITDAFMRGYLAGRSSADAVHGEWIRVGHDIYECSLCHQNVMTKDIDCYSYCHRCGAKMKGGDTE